MGDEGAWQRAGLSLAMLARIAHTPMHGYGIARMLEASGYGSVAGATLYPALARLEEHGYVIATWSAGAGGPGRKVFHITNAGMAELERLRVRWRAFVVAVDAIDEPLSIATTGPGTDEGREVRK